jgi:hypothetical protein
MPFSFLTRIFHKQTAFYEEVKTKLNEALGRISSTKRSHHPLLDMSALVQDIKDAIDKAHQQVKEAESSHPDPYESDPLHDELTTLLHGLVGPAYRDEELQALYKEGDQRYKLPPGYMDQRQDIGCQEPFPALKRFLTPDLPPAHVFCKVGWHPRRR